MHSIQIVARQEENVLAKFEANVNSKATKVKARWIRPPARSTVRLSPKSVERKYLLYENKS